MSMNKLCAMINSCFVICFPCTPMHSAIIVSESIVVIVHTFIVQSFCVPVSTSSVTCLQMFTVISLRRLSPVIYTQNRFELEPSSTFHWNFVGHHLFSCSLCPNCRIKTTQQTQRIYVSFLFENLLVVYVQETITVSCYKT